MDRRDNQDTTENLLSVALDAAKQLTRKPSVGRVELRLAPARYKFWSLRGYPYLLVIDAENTPPVVARFVHQARDLPVVLDDL